MPERTPVSQPILRALSLRSASLRTLDVARLRKLLEELPSDIEVPDSVRAGAKADLSRFLTAIGRAYGEGFNAGAKRAQHVAPADQDPPALPRLPYQPEDPNEVFRTFPPAPLVWGD